GEDALRREDRAVLRTVRAKPRVFAGIGKSTERIKNGISSGIQQTAVLLRKNGDAPSAAAYEPADEWVRYTRRAENVPPPGRPGIRYGMGSPQLAGSEKIRTGIHEPGRIGSAIDFGTGALPFEAEAE